MEAKVCACGCGDELNAGSPWNYKRGHKPAGEKKPRRSSPPPSTSRTKREAVEVEEPEEESVDCAIPVSKLDAIYELLTPYQKAVAVMSGVGEQEE